MSRPTVFAMAPALLLATLTWSPVASALRVNACGEDAAIGPGLINLQMAILAGGDITFDCRGRAELHVRQSHTINQRTTIDGGGTVTLVVERSSLPTFTVAFQQQLQLRHITLRSAGTVPAGQSPGLATVLVGRRARSTWTDVTVNALARPLFVLQEGQGIIEGGSFTGGTDPLRVQDGYLEIGKNTAFTNWTTAVRMDKGRLRIAGATFRRSRLILSGCELAISDAVFEDNDVRTAGLSGGAIDTDCKGQIERSIFRNNKAVAGGAIELRAVRDLRLFRLRFFGNEATGDGGAVHRQAFLSFRNTPQRILSIHHTVFRGNVARNGGGAWIGSGIVDVRAAHFANNIAAQQAGALYGRALRVTRGTFVRNRAGQEGGAMHAYIARHPFAGLTTNVVSNTLVVQNDAPRGAGIYGSALRIINSTIADNQGPGIDGGQSTVAPAITVINSLLVANSGPDCFLASGNRGVIVDGGSNLQFPNGTCPGMPIRDPTLDPLYAPVVGSPALDGATLQVCVDGPVQGRDVYGEPRPQGRGCSIGAVEGAVDRLVYDRLKRRGHEVPRDLIQSLRDALSRFEQQRVR